MNPENEQDLAERFAQAFNQRDTRDLASLLCDDATAQVIGSGWPEEKGKLAILATSIPHILSDGVQPLTAEAHRIGGGVLVLLRRKQGRELDTLLRLQVRPGKITRIEYLVTGFSRDEMIAIVQPLGIKVCTSDDGPG